MREDLADFMRKKSDEELYAMSNHQREDWMADALEAAEYEFESRNLSPSRIDEIRASTEVTRHREEAIANEPLPLLLKLVFFFFNPATCVGLFVLVPTAEIAFNNRGYERKYRQAWEYMGFGTLVILIVLGVRMLLIPLH